MLRNGYVLLYRKLLKELLFIMKPFIDVHSHILPGVEDIGCASKEEALAMLKLYEDAGVEAVVCTPHFGIHGIRGANVSEAFSWIQSVDSPVKRYLGQQVLLTRYTLQDARRGIAKTMAGSNQILVDYEEGVFYSASADILDGMKMLAESEYIPILAQPEKYPGLQQYPDICRQIVDAGARLQINVGNVFCDNVKICDTVRFLLENRLVSYVGSNAHNPEEMKQMDDGLKWIYDHCPQEYADAVVHDNAVRIING
jgi:tyrosine-protein phosphatase YwqE